MHYESMKDELNIDGGKHVLAMFLNRELFRMNNYKTVIEFGGCYPPRHTASTDNTLLDLHNSS